MAVAETRARASLSHLITTATWCSRDYTRESRRQHHQSRGARLLDGRRSAKVAEYRTVAQVCSRIGPIGVPITESPTRGIFSLVVTVKQDSKRLTGSSATGEASTAIMEANQYDDRLLSVCSWTSGHAVRRRTDEHRRSRLCGEQVTYLKIPGESHSARIGSCTPRALLTSYGFCIIGIVK